MVQQFLGDQRLFGLRNHFFQMLAGVLAGIQPLAVLGDARLVNQGKAKAAITGGKDMAVERCEGTG